MNKPFKINGVIHGLACDPAMDYGFFVHELERFDRRLTMLYYRIRSNADSICIMRPSLN